MLVRAAQARTRSSGGYGFIFPTRDLKLSIAAFDVSRLTHRKIVKDGDKGARDGREFLGTAIAGIVCGDGYPELIPRHRLSVVSDHRPPP